MTTPWARRLTRTIALGTVLLGVAIAGPAWAQDSASSVPADAASSAPADASAGVPSPQNPLSPEQVAVGRAAWKKSDCSNCHGWSGNGHDTGPIPPGPSLRETQLDYDSLHQIIQCGVPGTRMPYHDRSAYVDDRCYGMKSADIGSNKPPKGQTMKAEEIDAIAAYVAGFLRGKGDITLAECTDYHGSGAASCAAYH